MRIITTKLQHKRKQSRQNRLKSSLQRTIRLTVPIHCADQHLKLRFYLFGVTKPIN